MPKLPTQEATQSAAQSLPGREPTQIEGFADALSEVTRLARQKRNRMTLETTGEAFAPGTLKASEFGSLLGSINRASTNTFKDLVDAGALDKDQDRELTISEARSLGVPIGTRLSDVRGRTFGDATDTEAGIEGFSDISTDTLTVLDGFSTLDDLTDSVRQKVNKDLRTLGFTDATPPGWFTAFLEEQQQATVLPEEVSRAWETYRNSVLQGEAVPEFSVDPDVIGRQAVLSDEEKILVGKFPDFETQIIEALNSGFTIQQIEEQLATE